MTTPDDIVNYARTWIGAPWRHQGRGTGASRGIDCAGLLLVVARHFGLPNGDLTGYRRDPGRKFIENIEKHTDPAGLVPVHGAIGIFNDTVQPCHAGIFAVRPDGLVTVIHSEASPAGRVHEEAFASTANGLKQRLIGVRYYRGVSYER